MDEVKQMKRGYVEIRLEVQRRGATGYLPELHLKTIEDSYEHADTGPLGAQEVIRWLDDIRVDHAATARFVEACRNLVDQYGTELRSQADVAMDRALDLRDRQRHLERGTDAES